MYDNNLKNPAPYSQAKSSHLSRRHKVKSHLKAKLMRLVCECFPVTGKLRYDKNYISLVVFFAVVITSSLYNIVGLYGIRIYYAAKLQTR